MTFSRSLLFGRPTNIMVPWMNPVGLARNLSRLASSHVMLPFFIAAEKLNPGTVPLLLPTTPASDGPVLLSPGFIEWHTAQWLAKTAWPALGSPAAHPAEEPRRTTSNPAVAIFNRNRDSTNAAPYSR